MANKLFSELSRGAYSGATAYTVGDFVTYNGSSYACIVNTTGNLPTDATKWALLASKGDTGATGSTGSTGATGSNGADGLDVTWLGAYAGGTSYVINDAVSYGGSSYICILASTGNLPTNGTYWNVMASKGDAGAGTGDVLVSGTPVNNQLAIWTNATTIEGDASLTYDGTSFNLATAKNFQIAGETIVSDSAGTKTLQNIDALDATTEATIEGAIDTLANLTSVQGRTVTLADAGANAIFGWDDVASAYENLTQGEVRAVAGLATTDSPEFTAVNIGHASDTTVSRSAAGVIAVEGVVIPSISSTNILTNKRKQPRVYSAANNASLTPEIDTYDIFHLTAMSANTTINNHSTSTPADGELMEFRFLDNATPRTLTWGSAYVAKAGVALPTTTTTSKNLTVLFEYNSNLAKWNCMATGLEA
jgi:hypothetical protein